MLGSDTLRGYNDTIILHVLMDGDNYGYAISARIETDSFGLYPIKETTLYSAFARMEKKGLVTSYYGDESFGRRRIYYSVTDEGKKYYAEKCREWQLTKKVIDEFTRKDA